MPKFIIIWDAGYGDTAQIVEAETQEDAEVFAYEAWKDDVESQADYKAKPYSDSLAEDYNLTEE